MNPIKICFLLHIKVSENCLLDGYELLDSFYENNMTRAFTRSKPLEKFFDEKWSLWIKKFPSLDSFIIFVEK